jgi:hypothetical protein
MARLLAVLISFLGIVNPIGVFGQQKEYNFRRQYVPVALAFKI